MNFKLPIFLFLILINFGCTKKNSINEDQKKKYTFNYNIPYTPQSFDPLLQRGINARYLLNHLHQTIYKWDSNDNLVLSAAEKCKWNKTILVCHLKKGNYFNFPSTKKPKIEIKALHYIYSLELMKENPKSEILNFKDIKFYAKDDFTIAFELKSKTESFLHKLTQIEVSPRPEKKLYSQPDDYYTSGTYKILDFKKNQNIKLKHLTNNIFIKAHFIDDQSTALRMYESQKLDLLTNVPVREFKKYMDSNQLLNVPMSRMDGIFFNSSMDLNLKKALFHSLDFKKLQNLYYSIGVPGCPSLPKKLYNGEYCYDFDLEKAKDFLKKSALSKEKITLSFSSLGGDDIQRGMEWMAYEWKKNLNLNVAIEPLETGLFLNKIKTRKFDIIRRGLPLDSPKCLDGLDQFYSLSPNNVNKFKDTEFDKYVDILRIDPNLKAPCDNALKILHDNYVYLPLGNMYFSFLHNNKFSGWFINSLNVVDLEHLKRNSP